MKRLLFFLLFFLQATAHHPFLDDLRIKQWCESLHGLSRSDLLLWQNYLSLDKEMATMCSKNTTWVTTQEGKQLEQKIDRAINNILQQPSLQQSFREFVDLVKAELALNQESEYTGQHQVKINFKVLALVCAGCLHCVNESLQLHSTLS